MDFTAEQQDILFRAWLLARDGNGQVVTDEAIPDAHELAEHGWLERRFENATGELCWFWTDAAEHALDFNELLRSADGRQN